MTNPGYRITEPTLPEHALIRDSAPTPALSRGFRERVLNACDRHIASVRKKRRMRAAGAAAVVCCLTLLMCVILPLENDSSDPQPSVAQPAPIQPTQPASWDSRSERIAVDGTNAPHKQVHSEELRTDQLIEDLGTRHKNLLNANMLPKF